MIVRAIKKDLEQIYELGNLITPNFKKNYNESSLFNDYTKILVYKNNEKIIGFIHFEIMYETINILNIVVDQDFRRQNIASILLDNLLSELSNKDIEHIMLEVDTKNIAAINLYKKFNFKIINTRKKYYAGSDAYIMERRVK